MSLSVWCVILFLAWSGQWHKCSQIGTLLLGLVYGHTMHINGLWLGDI